jgi:hypothetical protein
LIAGRHDDKQKTTEQTCTATPRNLAESGVADASILNALGVLGASRGACLGEFSLKHLNKQLADAWKSKATTTATKVRGCMILSVVSRESNRELQRVANNPTCQANITNQKEDEFMLQAGRTLPSGKWVWRTWVM